jgi:hemoglobin
VRLVTRKNDFYHENFNVAGKLCIIIIKSDSSQNVEDLDDQTLNMIKKDIENIQDIQQLVDTFYEKIQKDLLLGDLFATRIFDWPKHLEKMYRFWQTVLLEQHTYSGSPFLPHTTMPLTGEHFDRWVAIWKETINWYFQGIKANEAKWRGEAMAAMFLSKIEFYKGMNAIPLI